MRLIHDACVPDYWLLRWTPPSSGTRHGMPLLQTYFINILTILKAQIATISKEAETALKKFRNNSPPVASLLIVHYSSLSKRCLVSGWNLVFRFATSIESRAVQSSSWATISLTMMRISPLQNLHRVCVCIFPRPQMEDWMICHRPPKRPSLYRNEPHTQG